MSRAGGMGFRRVAGAVSAAALLMLTPVPARAHATLVSSDPADGAELPRPPDRILLRFDEALYLDLSSFELRALGGDLVPLGRAEGSPRDPGLVVLRPAPLSRGVYALSWAVMSQEDAHVVRGMIVFGVQAPVSTIARPPEPRDPVRPLEILLRWVDLVAVVGLLGGWIAAGAVLRRPDPSTVEGLGALRARAYAFAAGCGAAAVVAGIGLLLSQAGDARTAAAPTPSLASAVRALLGGGKLAWLWGIQQTCLLSLTGMAWHMARADRAGRPSRRALEPAAGALVVALAGARAATGHAAAPRSGWIPVAVDAVHLLAAATWIGGLSALAVALLRGHRGSRGAPGARELLRSFGRLALGSFAVLLVTGLLSMARQVATPDGLVLTGYGRALLAKVGLVAAAGAFGLANAVILRPVPWLARAFGRPVGWTPVPPRRLSAFVLAEVSLGLLALGAVGIMTSTRPPREPGPGPAPVVASRSGRVGDLLISLSVTPNLPGANVVEVRVASTRRPALVPIERVALKVGDGEPIPLVPAGEQRYRAGLTALDRPGSRRLAIVVERAGLPTRALAIDWMVGGGPSPTPPVLSDRPLGGPLTAVAGGIALALLIAAAWLIGRSNRARRSEPRWAGERLSEQGGT